MSAVVRFPVSQIAVDEELYPRESVDWTWVSVLVEKLRAGETLDPIVLADGAAVLMDGRPVLVDGRHRTLAYERLFGPTAEVPAVVRTYASREEILEDAARLNAKHGKPFTTADMTRVILLAEQRGIALGRIARALGITEERAQVLRVRVAYVKPESAQEKPKVVVLKRSTAHLSGKVLSPKQALANRRAPGTLYAMLVRQLIDALQSGIAPTDDAAFRELLRELSETIDRTLALTPS